VRKQSGYTPLHHCAESRCTPLLQIPCDHADREILLTAATAATVFFTCGTAPKTVTSDSSRRTFHANVIAHKKGTSHTLCTRPSENGTLPHSSVAPDARAARRTEHQRGDGLSRRRAHRPSRPDSRPVSYPRKFCSSGRTQATPCCMRRPISGHLDQIPATLLVHDHLIIASKSGYTALHAARRPGSTESDSGGGDNRGSPVDRQRHGDTAVHAAAFAGHLDQIPPRCSQPSCSNVRNYDGITPIRTAERNGHLDQIPLASGQSPGIAKTDHQNGFGDTEAPWG